MKKAFVLSGGSIRGAFQAGAIADILTSGCFKPDVIYGTSVGSLNGAFLADRAGRAVIAGKSPNWVNIGNELHKFWLEKITSFEKIGKKKSYFGLLISVIFNKFDGFIDTTALSSLVNKEIKFENLQCSPLKFFACTVNVATGKPVYASSDTHSDMLNYIIASTAIPMVMPLKIIKNEPYTDGGIREVAPLRQAIHDGAEEIYCIVCQPPTLQRQKFNRKNAISVMERMMEIVTNETLNNDINNCIKINDLLKYKSKLADSSVLKNKRKIYLKVIRPNVLVDLELEKFYKDEILKALKFGWKTSQEIRAV